VILDSDLGAIGRRACGQLEEIGQKNVLQAVFGYAVEAIFDQVEFSAAYVLAAKRAVY